MVLTLRARLIAGIAFVAALLVVVSVVLTVTTRDELIDQVDARLTSFSPGGRDIDRFDLPPPDQPAPPPPDVEFQERVSDAYQGYIADDGTLRTGFTPNLGDREYGIPDLDGVTLPASGPIVFTTGSVDGDTTYRVLAQPLGEVIAITALPIDDVEATITTLLWVEVIGSLAILAALGLVGWWVVHLGIRPIKEMTETATRIADGDLSVRVEETRTGTESGQLATALNRMLGHIEAAIDERAASEERVRRFVADASHELRTPVTTIRGYAELYRHGGLADGRQLDDAMRRTEQEAARMSRLVEDMLTLARLDEQRPLASTPIDLQAIVEDAAADAGAVDPNRTISVDHSGSTSILGDEDRIRQVLANVVGNALVHTEPGVAIDLRVIGDGEHVTIEIADHGSGMEPEIAGRVTERFFRADPSRSRHRGGSGLGMSIADSAVAAHGGSITIDSRPGDGTTVRLVFPAAPDDELPTPK